MVDRQPWPSAVRVKSEDYEGFDGWPLALTIYFVAIFVAASIGIIAAVAEGASMAPTVGNYTWEARLLGVALVSGLLGGTLYGAYSFNNHWSARDLYEGYGPWYLFRPLIGSLVGLTLYGALRGGLLAASGPNSPVNPFIVLIVAAIGGYAQRPSLEFFWELSKLILRPPQKDNASPAAGSSTVSSGASSDTEEKGAEDPREGT